jgi:ribonuclease HII
MSVSNDPSILARWQAKGYRRIAGIDEVGRGPLAGPVVAAAILLPDGFLLHGLADSKTLSAAKRRILAQAICESAEIGLASVPAPVIDAINIRQASLLAMARAVLALPNPPDAILVDGQDLPPLLSLPGEAIIRGDQRVQAIAAASIVAKVFRDQLMSEAENFFPGYDFAKNAGYPTKSHRQAIISLGLTPLHRHSFAPCKNGTGAGKAL